MSAYVLFITMALLWSAHASIDSVIEEVELEYDKRQSHEHDNAVWSKSNSEHDDKVVIVSFLMFCVVFFKHLFTDAAEEGVMGGRTLPVAPRPAWDDFSLANKPGETFVKYQLDMIISKDTFRELMESDNSTRKKRNAVWKKEKLWPGTVPYVIDDSFNITQKYEIQLALQHVMQHTCVVFTPHTKERNYLKFVKVLDGCCTHVGMQGDEHHLNLAPNCITKPIISHEIGHALGLYHEHMRYDRDDHVTVHTDNVLTGSLDQFYVEKGNEYDKPYDYRSLMHYGKHYFANKTGNQRLITLEPKVPKYLDVIGEAPGLSFYDVQILNDMYSCSVNCKPVKCDKGQFLGKNCECFCEGSPEESAVPCRLAFPSAPPADCFLPDDLDPNNHFVLDITDNKVVNLTMEHTVRSGNTLEISYADSGTCGRHAIDVTCHNGTWDRDFKLPCVKVRCQLDPAWGEQFEIQVSYVENMNAVLPTDLPHGEYVYLNCTDNSINVTLVCRNGSWDGILIPCEGNDCIVRYDKGTDYVYTDSGAEILRGETVGHGQIVEAECKAVSDDVTSVTCSDGQWLGDPPTNCPRVRCQLDQAWGEQFEIQVSYVENMEQTDLPHGESVDLWCIGSSITVTLECRNGDWEGMDRLIPCEVSPQCPVIPYAIVTSDTRDVHRFTIDCLPGYDKLDADTGSRLVTSSFVCTRQGTWSPSTPICSPAKCFVPPIQAGVFIRPDLNVQVQTGNFIESGDVVKLKCDRGHIPDDVTVTCALGEWNVNLFDTVCTKVVCEPPPVEKTKFGPVKDEYIYTDVVNVEPCERNNELVGENQLTCLRNSTWSASAKCQPYCAHGKTSWAVDSGFKVNRRGVFVKRASTFDLCKKKCEKQRGFLCLSVSFGFEERSRTPSCLLHKLDLDKNPGELEEGLKWAVARRVCVTGQDK